MWAQLAIRGRKQSLKVLVQGSQNRDFVPPQNGTFGYRRDVKSCLPAPLSPKRRLVPRQPAGMVCRRNRGVQKWRFLAFSGFGPKVRFWAIFRKRPKSRFSEPPTTFKPLKCVKPPPFTLETSLVNLCLGSENRNFFPFSGY